MKRARCATTWLWAAVLLCSLAGGPLAAEPGQPIALGSDLEVSRLEEDLWLYRAGTELEPFGAVTSNGLIVGGSEGAWLIDTPWSDAQTAVLLDWIEARVGPLSGLVATHFHEDRMGGIAEVHRRGIESWGHLSTARLGAAAGFEPPRRTFEAAQELSTGSEAFEVFYPGAGHTLDNTVVWFPERKLLFGGCLVKSAGSKGAGFVGDAVLEAWPESLEILEKRYPDALTVIPGHGRAGGLDLLAHTAGLVGKAAESGD